MTSTASSSANSRPSRSVVLVEADRNVPFKNVVLALDAAEKAKEGRLTLDHVVSYNREIDDSGIETDRVAPMLLPDYRRPEMQRRYSFLGQDPECAGLGAE